MPVNPIVGRREALAAGLAGAATVALAACSNGSSSTSSGGGNGGGGGAKTGERVARLDSVPVGQSASASIGSDPVVMYRTGQDSVVCFSAICTHAGCTVNPDGAKFACPCHGSMYDARTGKVLQGPAPSPLPRVKVKVSGGEIVTA
jgi:Rieske Fe-S protein